MASLTTKIEKETGLMYVNPVYAFQSISVTFQMLTICMSRGYHISTVKRPVQQGLRILSLIMTLMKYWAALRTADGKQI
jgi:hypothetical protein